MALDRSSSYLNTLAPGCTSSPLAWARSHKLAGSAVSGVDFIKEGQDLFIASDMRFVQNVTLPGFQAKTFTLSISPNFNSFSDKDTKKE